LWVADLGARRGWTRVHAHFAGEAAEWALAVATVLDLPMSVTVHAVDLFVPRPALTEVLRAARPAITVCDHHARWIAERHGVEAHVVRCGVRTDVPCADPGGPLRVVSVARDVPKKGLDSLVRVARAAVPEAPLRLVSDAHRLGGPGVSVGPVAPDRVPEVLARATLFALPCRVAASGDRDGLPVALLEAMAAGLPVVSTVVAGVPEVVDDGVGWLVPPDDDLALAVALRAARDPAARVERGRAARARIVERGLTVTGQVDALLAAWGGA
jgi:colanic acid/amylovoran biosynthesis glycosyltransferase